MKNSLFNQIERQIMHEDKSLSASRMKLHIAKKQFEKGFTKTFAGRVIEKTIDLFARICSQLTGKINPKHI